MQIETRQAALGVVRRGDLFLVSEMTDPHTGVVLHRFPGGGLEPGETPDQALRREWLEELEITLTQVEALGSIDHEWFWKGRRVRERAWFFLVDPECDERLGRGETPELLEADGQRVPTLWRPLAGDGLVRLCPDCLPDHFE